MSETIDIVDIGTKLGVDWTIIPKEEFIAGFQDELEHKDVTGGDPVATAKIALAHLKEDPHYYSKLKQALEAKKMYKPQAVKFIDEEQGIIGGMGIPYGGPMPGNKDLEGEDFGPDTNLHEDWFDRRPILYHHGLDPDLKDEPIGVQTVMKTVEGGRWIEGQLNKSHAYWENVKQLIKAGKLYWSSHCPPHLKMVSKDGHITNWPVVEFTLTPTPANPYGTVDSFKAIRDLKSIGIAEEALKAIEEKEGAPKSPPKEYPKDKSKYADPKNFKYPIDDDAHVRAAVSYFNHEGQRAAGKYSPEEWAEIGGRIARAASEKLGAAYQYAGEKVTQKEEAAKMAEVKPEDKSKIAPAVGDQKPAAVPEAEKPIEEKKEPVVAETEKCNAGKDAKKDGELSLPGNVVKAALNLHTALKGLIPGICEMEDLVEEEAGAGGEAAPENKVPPTSNPGVSQGMEGEDKVSQEKPIEEKPAEEKPAEEKPAEENVAVDEEKKVAKAAPVAAKSVAQDDALKALQTEQDRKITEAVKAAVEPLQAAIKKIAEQPVTEGPVRVVATAANPKIAGVEAATKAAVLAEMIETETDPSVRQALSNKAALLEMNATIKAGTQPIRKR